MLNSTTFDLKVNAFQDFVNEVFSGTDENQKAKLRTKLNQFSKISNLEWDEKTDGQIVSVQVKKRILSNVENILPPEMVEKILKLLTCRDICQAKLICRRWKEIIDKGNLVKKVAGKMFEQYLFSIFSKP